MSLFSAEQVPAMSQASVHHSLLDKALPQTSVLSLSPCQTILEALKAICPLSATLPPGSQPRWSLESQAPFQRAASTQLARIIYTQLKSFTTNDK